MDNRKRRILQAIVEEYINTAEPVSSGSIVKKYGLDLSSATIRNEMAELEKVGYLEKPHTSSGRVPSAKGYRLYVNELLNDQNISLDSNLQEIYNRIIEVNIINKSEKKNHVKNIRNKISEDNSKVDNMICPKCGGNLVVRNGKYGSFIGCSNYPKCKFTKKR